MTPRAPFAGTDPLSGCGPLRGESLRHLRQAPFFASLPEHDLASLASTVSSRTYRRRDLIAQPEDTDSCWLVAAGSARLYAISKGGQEITLRRLAPGDLYGLIFLSGTAPGSGQLEATADGTIVDRFPLDRIRSLCLTHPHLGLAVAEVLGQHLAGAYSRIEDLALHEVRVRLAHVLARLASGNPGGLVTETHRELAALVGVRPEEVTRQLRRLRTEGLVGYAPERSALIALDIDRLRDYE